ncbi:MAG: hypothetical protein E6Q58_05065 [Niabella sp.]|nr:MAG: hypothetical protein E6Q58_05065 [Niabella sp.]
MNYYTFEGKQTHIYIQSGLKRYIPIESTDKFTQTIWQKMGMIVSDDTHNLHEAEIVRNLPGLGFKRKDVLHESIYRKLNTQDLPLLIIAYDQGGAEAYTALKLGQHFGHRYPHLSFVTVGSSSVNGKNFQTVCQAVDAHYLGNIADQRDPCLYLKTMIAVSFGLIALGIRAGYQMGVAKWIGDGYIGGWLGWFFCEQMGICLALPIVGIPLSGLLFHLLWHDHALERYFKKPMLQYLLSNWCKTHHIPRDASLAEINWGHYVLSPHPLLLLARHIRKHPWKGEWNERIPPETG